MKELFSFKGGIMGKEKFAARDVDEDTKILSAKYLQYDKYDLLIEEWFWDGIYGKSLIFLSDQVSSFKDLQLKRLAKSIVKIADDQATTLTRNKDYSYFNYGFRSE